jgi:hypothetical protein
VTELVHRGSRHSCRECCGPLLGCLVLLVLRLLLGRHRDVVKIHLHTHKSHRDVVKIHLHTHTSHRHLVKIHLHTCLQVTHTGARTK